MALSRLTTNSFTPNGITLKDISTAPSQLNGMKNLLINGDFRVWQKGTDLNPVSTGNGVTGVDRWTNQYCDFTARLRKVEDTISGETVDTAEITKTGGTYSSCEFTQKVETSTAKYLRGQTVTFSFWIKKIGATLGSHNFDCWIGDSETVDDTGWGNPRTVDRSRATRPVGVTGGVAFTSTDVWQKVKITRTLSADTNTIYCTIYTQSTPLNEGVRIAKCQLEIGSVATDVERRPYTLDEHLSQRYYWQTQSRITGGSYAYEQIGQGFIRVTSTTSSPVTIQVPYPAPMRIRPSIGTTNGVNFVCQVANTSHVCNANISNWSVSGNRIGWVDFDVDSTTSFSVGQAVSVYCNNGASDIYFNAEF